MIVWLMAAGWLMAQKDPYSEFIAQTKPRTPEEERMTQLVQALKARYGLGVLCRCSRGRRKRRLFAAN